MEGWPPIGEADLLARLALGDAAFGAFLEELGRAVGPRAFTEDAYAAALAYPWARPPSSFTLRDSVVEPVGAGAGEPAGAHADPARWPLLAFGANGAPERLALKLAHLPASERTLVAQAGALHDFDVGASAHPTIYGALPGTLIPSPGTAVRATVLWVTAAQLTALTWTELSYALGRLDGVRFVPDVDGDVDGAAPLSRVLAYVSRIGAHTIDGAAVAMAAVAATDRRARACTQEELLDDVAVRLLGPGARARTLVSAVMEDFRGVASILLPALAATAAPFASPCWTPYPAGDVG